QEIDLTCAFCASCVPSLLPGFREKPNGDAQVRNEPHVGVFQADKYFQYIPVASFRGIPGSGLLAAHLGSDGFNVAQNGLAVECVSDNLDLLSNKHTVDVALVDFGADSKSGCVL